MVDKDACVFKIRVPGPSGDTNHTVMYHVKQDLREDGTQPGPMMSTHTPSMHFHSGSTYVTKPAISAASRAGDQPSAGGRRDTLSPVLVLFFDGSFVPSRRPG
jgi:hypothetical protein